MSDQQIITLSSCIISCKSCGHELILPFSSKMLTEEPTLFLAFKYRACPECGSLELGHEDLAIEWGL